MLGLPHPQLVGAAAPQAQLARRQPGSLDRQLEIGDRAVDGVVLAALPKYPIITAGVAETEVARTRPAIINGLAQLESIGALKRHRNQKKGDSWEAKELFKLLDEFEKAVKRPPASSGVSARSA